MSALQPLRVLGPALLVVCLGIGVVLPPMASALAGIQFALLLVGGLLITSAAYPNPVRSRTGWQPLLGVGEVAIGVVVPLGILGTGIDASLGHLYGAAAATAALGLAAVIGSQLLVQRA